MRSLPLILGVALSLACVDTLSPVETADTSEPTPDLVEVDATPDAPDVIEPAFEDMPPPTRPAGPLLESFTYTRQYQDCTTVMCLTQIQFGIRGGVVWWVQGGALAQSTPLNDTEYEELVELVGKLEFLEMMQRGFVCPDSERDDGFRVEFMLQVEQENGTSMLLTDDVTGCYYEEGEAHAERLIAFSEDIFLKYYK